MIYSTTFKGRYKIYLILKISLNNHRNYYINYQESLGTNYVQD